MTIWKFSIKVTDHQFVEMPRGARVIYVDTQYDNPCLWALVDPDEPTERVSIRVFGTGHSGIESADKYLGSFQMVNGSVVFHVFEKRS